MRWVSNWRRWWELSNSPAHAAHWPFPLLKLLLKRPDAKGSWVMNLCIVHRLKNWKSCWDQFLTSKNNLKPHQFLIVLYWETSELKARYSTSWQSFSVINGSTSLKRLKAALASPAPTSYACWNLLASCQAWKKGALWNDSLIVTN